jgi:hypothetical protein
MPLNQIQERFFVQSQPINYAAGRGFVRFHNKKSNWKASTQGVSEFRIDPFRPLLDPGHEVLGINYR